jgi:hypothetical protein
MKERILNEEKEFYWSKVFLHMKITWTYFTVFSNKLFAKGGAAP